jgi:hypothetical protein
VVITHDGEDAMTMTTPRHEGPEKSAAETALEQIGGLKGFVLSTVPVVVFVAANAFLSLTTTLIVSIAAGLAITGYRLLTGERFSTAISGLLGLAVAAGIVAWTGSARDFFAVGIWISLAGFVLFLGSVLARRPLTGVVWNLVHGREHDWRADKPSLRVHDLATLVAAAVFGSRFVVSQWLYLADSTTWLGVARVAMGTPLTIVSVLVMVWAFRRTSKRLLPK